MMEEIIIPSDTNYFKWTDCRFCATNTCSSDLLNFIDDEKEYQNILSLIDYFNMTYIDVSKDKLSKMVCKACYNFIIEAYVFFEKVKQTQINLNEMYHIKAFECLDQDQEIKEEKYESDQDVNYPHSDEPLISVMNDCESDKVLHKDIDYSPLDMVIFQENIQNKRITTILRPRKRDNLVAERKHTTRKTKKIEAELPIEEMKPTIDSWIAYPWICMHCKIKCATMQDLRSHSKEEHHKCYGFKCFDCKTKLNSFSIFVSHVRDHRDILRHYCQYCNQKFESSNQCEDHTMSHGICGKTICNVCGEVFVDSESLQLHNSKYKKVLIRIGTTLKRVDVTGLRADGSESSWVDYTWFCQVCGKGFDDVMSLRLHGQEIHDRCFAISCMDCKMRSKSFNKFVSHVQRHRPYLKQYCPYCNKQIKNEKQLATHIKRHFDGAQKPCYGCGQIFINNDVRKQHMKKFVTPRPDSEIDPEDLVCSICHKTCQTLAKLKIHKETHNSNRIRNFTCDTCGKAFFNLGTLKGHITLHKEKTQVCKICQKSFFTKTQLKDHVRTHLDQFKFECDLCGSRFMYKSKIVCHLRLHYGYKPYKCKDCGKSFVVSNELKHHSYIHTGFKPYSCEICGKGFSNWGNCNKHMISNHGKVLGKRKLLSRNNVDLLDKGTKEWVNALITNKKRNSHSC